MLFKIFGCALCYLYHRKYSLEYMCVHIAVFYIYTNIYIQTYVYIKLLYKYVLHSSTSIKQHSLPYIYISIHVDYSKYDWLVTFNVLY